MKKILNKKVQTGNAILIIIIVAVVLFGSWYYLMSRANSSYQANQPVQQTYNVPAIQNDSELQKAANTLDNMNIDGTIDATLNQNATDSQNF
jgi:flagellar basal body-associated protein FliL